jgi:hypothetical protein
MTPKKIILHCSASKNGVDYPVAQIKKDHLARGFRDIGYHFVIQPNGIVYTGRATNEPGAHCEGENHHSVGICLVGLDKFTAAQFSALESVLDDLFMKYQTLGHSEIYCHHQFDSAKKQGKTCPNIPINTLLYWYHCKDDTILASYLLKGEARKNAAIT